MLVIQIYTFVSVVLEWEVFDKFTYSPDLTPSDYNLFQHLKSSWHGSIYPVATTCRRLSHSGLYTCVQKFVSCYEACFNSGGSYVER
ncbi:hypothetical protein AVEN_124728-1 [Araneus ventricosus]|uniref:Uncharacterized protein n=1 Tax=Araneus ventricosus TaxID=182803 RepID=A0A4Y2WL32_ARAVE|nr:hypothetical protein AVEN_124728-1 [Araneus ventricosus]